MGAVRLSVGTLSVLPVGVARRVDRATWGRAMLLAPVVGAGLGAVAWAVGAGLAAAATPFLGAVAVVAVDAALTRALHLDGLADVADGLGSRKPADQARRVMKQSDLGPFGVVALVLTVLLQVGALMQVLAGSTAVGAVVVIGAAAVSRASLTLSCRRGVAAAGDGLGAAVVGSVPAGAGWTVVATTAATVTASGLAVEAALPAAAAVVVALASGELWRRHCGRRLDGITGDVLGSVQQVSVTASLVAVALVL